MSMTEQQYPSAARGTMQRFGDPRREEDAIEVLHLSPGSTKFNFNREYASKETTGAAG